MIQIKDLLLCIKYNQIDKGLNFHNEINLWDVAAGKIIIEEAGGKVNNIHNYKIDRIDIRAGNPDIYEKILKKIDKF